VARLRDELGRACRSHIFLNAAGSSYGWGEEMKVATHKARERTEQRRGNLLPQWWT